MADRRILVVANETVAGRELLDDLRARAADGAEVLVVAPALNTRLRHLFADVDKAREGAEQRLAESIEHLQASGIQARGSGRTGWRRRRSSGPRRSSTCRSRTWW